MNKMLRLIIKIALFIVGISLIVINQKVIGWANLIAMIAGLAMLLWLMYDYNKKFQ